VETVYVNPFCGKEDNEIRTCGVERVKGREMGVEEELVDVEIFRQLKKWYTNLNLKVMMDQTQLSNSLCLSS
jgi:hypothetical protein